MFFSKILIVGHHLLDKKKFGDVVKKVEKPGSLPLSYLIEEDS